MGLELLQPSDFFSDTLSFEYIIKVLSLLESERDVIQKYEPQLINSFKEFFNECKETFIFHNLSQGMNLEKSILQKDIHIDLDTYNELTDEYYQRLCLIGGRLSQLLDGSENSVKLDYDDRNEWFFYCTNKRANTLKERLTNLNGNSIHVRDSNDTIIVSFAKSDFSYKRKDGSSTVIQFDECKKISKKLIIVQDNLKKLNKEEWVIRTKHLYEKYNLTLKKFYFFLSEVDCYCSERSLFRMGIIVPILKMQEKVLLIVKKSVIQLLKKFTLKHHISQMIFIWEKRTIKMEYYYLVQMLAASQHL